MGFFYALLNFSSYLEKKNTVRLSHLSDHTVNHQQRESYHVFRSTDTDSKRNIHSRRVTSRGKHGDIDHFALKPSGEYTRVINQEGYKEPEEFAEAVNGQQG